MKKRRTDEIDVQTIVAVRAASSAGLDDVDLPYQESPAVLANQPNT